MRHRLASLRVDLTHRRVFPMSVDSSLPRVASWTRGSTALLC
jgi:hypothetical protein